MAGWRPRLRQLWAGLIAAGISLAATAVLILTRPDRPITLLVYLPGITIAEAWFGLWGGVTAVALSVAGSAVYRSYFMPALLRSQLGSFYRTWEEEIILAVVGGVVVALMDLLRRSGARSQGQAQQMMALLENSADAVATLDSRLRLVAMNPAARALFAVPGRRLLGATLDQLRLVFRFESEHEKPLLRVEDLIARGLAARDEGSLVDIAHNRRLHVLLSTIPLPSARGGFAGALIIITDVTALKEMQSRVLDNARHLAIAQMVGGLTHDFSHVLDIIRRAVVVLDAHAAAPPEERRRYMEMIDRAAADGAGIVRRLRDYLAGGAGPIGAVDLARVAHEAVELTRPLWRTHGHVEVIEELAPVSSIQGSANDLRRVLVNLIFNSIEALGAAGGRIAVHTEERDHPPRLCAWVEDNGPGVGIELRNRLFEPYFTTKPHGMGMGLVGAQKIALAHHGNLYYTPAPGGGSRFTLELPRAELQEQAA